MMDSSKIKLERYAQRKDKTVEWRNMVMEHLGQAFKEVFKTEKQAIEIGIDRKPFFNQKREGSLVEEIKFTTMEWSWKGGFDILLETPITEYRIKEIQVGVYKKAIMATVYPQLWLKKKFSVNALSKDIVNDLINNLESWRGE